MNRVLDDERRANRIEKQRYHRHAFPRYVNINDGRSQFIELRTNACVPIRQFVRISTVDAKFLVEPDEPQNRRTARGVCMPRKLACHSVLILWPLRLQLDSRVLDWLASLYSPDHIQGPEFNLVQLHGRAIPSDA